MKTREKFQDIYVQISGSNSNFRTFQDKLQNSGISGQRLVLISSMYWVPSSTVYYFILYWSRALADSRHWSGVKFGYGEMRCGCQRV